MTVLFVVTPGKENDGQFIVFDIIVHRPYVERNPVSRGGCSRKEARRASLFSRQKDPPKSLRRTGISNYARRLLADHLLDRIHCPFLSHVSDVTNGILIHQSYGVVISCRIQYKSPVNPNQNSPQDSPRDWNQY